MTARKTGAAQAAARSDESPQVKQAIALALEKRGISDAQWRTLTRSLFPGANPNSVLLVWDYCQARRLDPMKKPCHIVPMRVKDPNGNWEWRDVIMPGIYEYRTTAQRTGEYLGHSEPEYGPTISAFGTEAPEWCAMTIKRWNSKSHQIAEFPVRVYFREVVATRVDKETHQVIANERWMRAGTQMLTKCTEAAGLREGFPDELGGEMTFEEMVDQEPIDMGRARAVGKPEVDRPQRRSAKREPKPEPEPMPEPEPEAPGYEATPDGVREKNADAGWPEDEIAKVVGSSDFDSMDEEQCAKALRILEEDPDA